MGRVEFSLVILLFLAMLIVLRLWMVVLVCVWGLVWGTSNGGLPQAPPGGPVSPRRSVTFSDNVTRAPSDELSGARPERRVVGVSTAAPAPPLPPSMIPSTLRQPEWRFHKFNLSNWSVVNLSQVVDDIIGNHSGTVEPVRLSPQRYGLHLVAFVDTNLCERDSECYRNLVLLTNFLNSANRINMTTLGTQTSTGLILIPIHETLEQHRWFFESLAGYGRIKRNEFIKVIPYEASLEILQSLGADRRDPELVNKVLLLDWTGESVPQLNESSDGDDMRGICNTVKDPMHHVKMCSTGDEYDRCVYGKISMFRDRCSFCRQ